MKRESKLPSEIAQDFIDFLEESKSLYFAAKEKCAEYDSIDRHIYWAHKFELAKDKAERNKLATAYQKERIARREYKNQCDLYRAINDFCCSENNKSILKRMRGMIAVQRSQEEYLAGKKEYKGGGEDADHRGRGAEEKEA